jgi:putative DNA primase/helicase
MIAEGATISDDPMIAPQTLSDALDCVRFDAARRLHGPGEHPVYEFIRESTRPAVTDGSASEETKMLHDLRSLARALDGEVVGAQVLAPGPGGHSRKDRSLSVRLSPTAPDGFLAFSHAGDDWRACRDYVRERLGLSRETAPRRPPEGRQRPSQPPQTQPLTQTQTQDDEHERKIASALSLWAAGFDPRGTPAETYLDSRCLMLDADIAGPVLRWHPDIGAMLALFRNIRTDEPQAVSRTFINREGKKLERRFLGPVGGAAIKLDADDWVTLGLHLAEGIETAMAGQQLGLRPIWALGSAGAIASFAVLSGVECLSLLAEADEASARASRQCSDRWRAAGREIRIVSPIGGKDLNDVTRGRR